MSVRTAEELSDRLASDLIWRKKELTVLSKLATTATPDREAVLVRSLVAILYAHWEGFLRTAGDSYLEYLRRRRLKYSDLTTNFVALGLQARVREAASRTNLEELMQLFDAFRNGLEQRSRLPKLSVDAESNLSSRVLKDMTTSLGINYEAFELKKVLIDERLLRNRNHVAHGDFLEVDAADALVLKDEIVGLMELFRDEIENAVAQTRYRAATDDA